MQRTIGAFVLLTLVLIATSASVAGDKIEFVPITEADWAVVEDSAKGIHGAAMIFEKILRDDENSYKGQTWVTFYRRIRVLSAPGREHGDVQVPWLQEKQKIEFIQGRTTRRNGEVTNLDKAEVVEREIFKTEDVKAKRQFFSLPGMSDDCIIEYIIRLRLENEQGGFNFWEIHKDIYLMKGELTWRLYKGKGLAEWDFNALASEYVPQYVAINLPRKLDVTKLPDEKNIEELVFVITDLPTFKKEPHSLPSEALRAQMRLYYAGKGSHIEFWSWWSEVIADWCNDFLDKSNMVKEVAKQFASLPSDSEKVNAAHDWLQSNIVNISYMKDADREKLKVKHDNADQALKNKHASRYQINYLFYGILRELGIQAKNAWVVDRDEDLLVEQAKYWQFDRNVVAVPVGKGVYDFYSPGDKWVTPGMLPWYCEGVKALMESVQGLVFETTQWSPSSANRLTRTVTVKLSDDLALSGQVSERRTGQTARWMRAQLDDLQPAEWPGKISTLIKDVITGVEVDSASVDSVDFCSPPLLVNATVTFPSQENALAGNRLMLRPMDCLAAASNPFTAEFRKSPIIFNYAFETEETLTVALPNGWTIEALPRNTNFKNTAGKCTIHFAQEGNTLKVTRSLVIPASFIAAASYQEAQKLYDTWAGSSGLTVMLTQPQQ